jgi:hypothetical protein
MPLLIGMDEAGYGPNLGPLVVTAVAWEVSGDAAQTDLWRDFAGIVSPDPSSNGTHLQIADSKVVYTPARGLAALETGVLGAVELWRGPRSGADGNGHCVPESFQELCRLFTAQTGADADEPPWLAGNDLTVPYAMREGARGGEAAGARLVERWRVRCMERGVRLRGIRSAIVSPQQFNEQTRRHDNKGRALSEISMHVLGQLWQEHGAASDASALIIADKHGGRNRYHDFLPIAFGDKFIRCREEGMDSSRYQVGRAEIRFETKSERHLPVALASMICKYIRELSMILFNRFWIARLPGLKPTAGYPLDARRYREQIAGVQHALGITDDVLWRER